MRYFWVIVLIGVFVAAVLSANFVNRSDAASFDWVTPTDGATVSRPVTLEVDPPADTQRVQFYVDNDLQDAVRTSPWTVTLDLADGTYDVRARASDADNTTLANESITVTVDGADEPTPVQASEPHPEAGDPTLEGTPEPNSAPGDATWLATGLMLNTEYDWSGFTDHWFYASRDGGDTWQALYSDMAGNDEYHGLMMNFRSSRALYSDDEVDEVIANLDDYRAHGVLMLTAGLQGGDGVNAFAADGALKEEYSARMVRLANAMSERGMVLTVYLFYQGLDEELSDAEAVKRGVQEVADAIEANDLRNVIIEIANEHNHGGFDHGIIKDDSDGTSGNIAELVMVAKNRFSDSPWRALVTASKRGNGNWSNSGLMEVADIAMIHGNNVDPATQAERAANVRDSVAYPVAMNEDNYLSPYDTGTPTAKTLDREKEAADELVAVGVSWGMMMAPWNQEPDYDWYLGPDPGLNGGGNDLNANYVHMVFDHIQARAEITIDPASDAASGSTSGSQGGDDRPTTRLDFHYSSVVTEP